MAPSHYNPAKRSLGQNFLIDESVISRIVAALGEISGANVVEIGPGRGALTAKLIEAGAVLTLIEKDWAMAELWRKAGQPRVIEADFLALNIDDMFSADFPPPSKLIGSLPYNVATPILERIASKSHYFSDVVFMFQREVAERICALPSNSPRGYLSVISQSAFEIERLFDVPPDAFEPRPKIWSTVLYFRPKPKPSFEQDGFRRLVSLGFQQKRKTLANNLKPYFEKLSVALDLAHIDGRRRAEDLSLEEWVRLNDTFDALGKRA